MYQDIIKCIKVLPRITCMNGDNSLPCRLSRELVLTIERECPIICFYALLKLLFETIVQETYYRLTSISEEEFEKIIAKRTREYASFKTWMITRLKDIDGVFKKKTLRLYLKLSSYVHPSIDLYKGSLLGTSTVLKIVDSIMYLYIIGRKDLVRSLCSGLQDEIPVIRGCGFDRTLRYLLKTCGSS